MLPTYNIHTSIHGLMTLINLLSQPSTSLSPIGEYSRVALSSIAFILDNASFHQSLVQYFKPNQENHHSVTLPPRRSHHSGVCVFYFQGLLFVHERERLTSTMNSGSSSVKATFCLEFLVVENLYISWWYFTFTACNLLDHIDLVFF